MNRHFLPPAGDNVDYEIIPFNNTMEVMAAIQGQIDIAFCWQAGKRIGE